MSVKSLALITSALVTLNHFLCHTFIYILSETLFFCHDIIDVSSFITFSFIIVRIAIYFYIITIYSSFKDEYAFYTCVITLSAILSLIYIPIIQSYYTARLYLQSVNVQEFRYSEENSFIHSKIFFLNFLKDNNI